VLINCLSSSKKIILHGQKETKQHSLFIDTRKPTCNAKIKTGVKNQIILEQPNFKAKIRQLWQNNLSMVNQPLNLRGSLWS